MNTLLIAHNPIFTTTPRGGEVSVRAIVDHLNTSGHSVSVVDQIPSVTTIKRFDVVLTWGRPASEAAKRADAAGVPLVLMVRFWKNIAPPMPNGGYGDLMRRELTPGFIASKNHLFRYASAIITNTQYAKNVIERWQPMSMDKVAVSYVPVLGKFEQSGDKDGTLTIITPEVYGEQWLVRQLVRILPDMKFLIVNADEWTQKIFRAISPNVEAHGYMDMEEVWKRTAILLNPVYNNDICGTRRVVPEAWRHGVPTLCMNRCGMDEKVPAPMLVTANAPVTEWAMKIMEMTGGHERFRDMAKEHWGKYDTKNELKNIEKIVRICASL